MTEVNCKECGSRYEFEGDKIPTGMICICNCREFK